MPITTGSQIVMASWNGENGRDILRLVHRCEQAIRRHLFLPELDPLASRPAMVIPVEFGMVGENLKTASYEKEDAEKIDEVVNSQPKGEAKFGHVRIHVTYSLSKTLLCADRFID